MATKTLALGSVKDPDTLGEVLQYIRRTFTLGPDGVLCFIPERLTPQQRAKQPGVSLSDYRYGVTFQVGSSTYKASVATVTWAWHEGELPPSETRYKDGNKRNATRGNLILREERLQAVVTADLLREYADYNPETGVFRWVKRVSERTRLNLPAKAYPTNRGNRRHTLSFMRQSRNLTHWIWLYMTGEKVWEKPEAVFVDHVNGDPSDNRWDNLRLANPQQNQGNRRGAVRKRHPSLPTGVCPSKGGQRFQGKVSFKRTIYKTPWFDSPEAAHEAYKALHQELHGEFSVYASRPEETP